MIGYLDLSIIVFLFNYATSVLYAMSVCTRRYVKMFIIQTMIIQLIAFLINLFFIPYFSLFAMIIYTFSYLLINIHLFKTLLLTMFFYLMNSAFLLLVGGCYLYKGIVMISIPYITLFIFAMPFLVVLFQFLYSIIIRQLKDRHFIVPCTLIVENKTYKEKGYIDTGNGATYLNIPIIFIKGKVPSNDGIVITISSIKGSPYKYIAYKGRIIIKTKEMDVYVVFVSDKVDFNSCKVLLNKNLF